MKHNKKRILSVINELTMNLLAAGATDINVRIQELETEYQITIQSNFCIEKQDKMKELAQVIQEKPQVGMEEFYWELAGESDFGNELHLAAMMVDRVEVELLEDAIKLELFRNKF